MEEGREGEEGGENGGGQGGGSRDEREPPTWDAPTHVVTHQLCGLLCSGATMPRRHLEYLIRPTLYNNDGSCYDCGIGDDDVDDECSDDVS